jgi:Flp pilus assembly protein protease CpaA
MPGTSRLTLSQAAGEATPMDLKDRRIWYVVAAIVIVVIIIAYAAGWFGGAPAPAPQG